MLKKLLATTAIVLSASAPTFAGSLAEPVVEPMPVIDVVAPSTDWSGWYAGVQGAVNVAPWFAFGGGVHAGYLNDMGDFVVGAEASYTYEWPPVWPFGRVDATLIAGYDAGDVMPHVTLGGMWMAGTPVVGLTFGAGASVMVSDNIMLTGRYRGTWWGPLSHEITAGVSYRF